jgi:hypothetical protein
MSDKMIDTTSINWLEVIKKGNELYNYLNIDHYKDKYSKLLDAACNITSSKVGFTTLIATFTASALSGGLTPASIIGAAGNTIKLGIPASIGISMLYDATDKFTQIKFSHSDYLFMAEGVASSAAAYYFSHSPITSIAWHAAIGALYRYGQHYSSENTALKNKLDPAMFAHIMDLRAQQEQANLDFVGNWEATKLATTKALLPMATNIALSYFTNAKLTNHAMNQNVEAYMPSFLKAAAAASFGISSAAVDADNPLSLGLSTITSLAAYLLPESGTGHE